MDYGTTIINKNVYNNEVTNNNIYQSDLSYGEDTVIILSCNYNSN